MHPQIFSQPVTRKPGIARGSRRAAWLAAAAAVTALTGCGPQLQTQIVGRSTAFGSYLGIPIANALTDLPNTKFYIPGSLLKVNVEETSSKSESPSSERQPVGPSDREMARVEYDAELERQGSVVGIVALVALIGFTVWLVKSEEGNSPP